MKIPNISRFPWKNLHSMMAGMMDIIDGIHSIVSLGTANPNLCMKYVTWVSVRMCKQRMEETKNEQAI